MNLFLYPVYIILALMVTPMALANTDIENQALKAELEQWLTHRQPAQFIGAQEQPLNYFQHISATDSDTALIYLHGIESHAGWFHLVGARLAGMGYDVIMPDRRGSGTNRQDMGLSPGYAASEQQLIEDLQHLVEQRTSGYKKRYLIGLSWGGKLALRYAMSYPDDIDGLILITPGLVAKVDYSVWQKMQIGFCAWLCDKRLFPGLISPSMFTDDPVFIEYISNDPLRNSRVSASFLWATRTIDNYIAAEIDSFSLPIQLHLAENDDIVDNQGIVELLNRSRSSIEQTDYKDQIHSLQFETPDQLSRLIAQWLSQQGVENAN
ncbi:alpha/beta fold hydrolase [Corallincola spongiicola]|uniref:Alpha/beta fold hydrolase n=2 Tax=Corallincola spongiicola TaxID=2520508 RepID=A0ABY1WVC2_9GAMM|nr:alpha/beta fold hydrolase [Corallincola spongiicola]